MKFKSLGLCGIILASSVFPLNSVEFEKSEPPMVTKRYIKNPRLVTLDKTKIEKKEKKVQEDVLEEVRHQKLKTFDIFRLDYGDMEKKLILLSSFLEMYKKDNDKYPSDLDKLNTFLEKIGGKIPKKALTDIGSEESIIYISNGKDYLMYSRGIDKKDDGGIVIENILVDGKKKVYLGDISVTSNPKFNPSKLLIEKAKEKSKVPEKEILKDLRGAITVYFGVNEGVYPKSLKELRSYYQGDFDENRFNYNSETGEISIKED